MRMMSAPASDSIMPAKGAGPSPASSMMRTPSSGPLIGHRHGGWPPGPPRRGWTPDPFGWARESAWRDGDPPWPRGQMRCTVTGAGRVLSGSLEAVDPPGLDVVAPALHSHAVTELPAVPQLGHVLP